MSQHLGSYSDHYRQSYASCLRERRLAGVMPAGLLHLSQPRGDFSDPPVDELVLIRDLAGCGSVTLDHGAGRFHRQSRREDLYFVPARTPTMVLLDEQSELQVACISLTQLSRLSREESGRGASIDAVRLAGGSFRSPCLSTLMDRMWETAGWGTNAGTLYSDSALTLLLHELANASGRPTAKAGSTLAPWQLKRVIDFMSADLAADTSLTELAALVGHSPGHFCRAFKAATGVPPHRWLIQLRVKKARELLTRSKLPIAEIATLVGYDDPAYFSRLVAKETGRPPRHWRSLFYK